MAARRHLCSMRFALLTLLLTFVASAASAQGLPAPARAYLGDWTVVDDETGEAQAVVRLTEAGGAVEGRIVRVLPTDEYPTPSFRCDDCEGEYRGADLREVRLVYGLEWDGERLSGGRIVDVRNDRTYKVVMNLERADRLRVRGYLGIRALGRTQIWQRAG